MIYKDSLLDAYMSLGGSLTQHLAMLVTIFLILKLPSEASNQPPKQAAEQVCLYSILTHATGFLLKLFMKWERFRLSKVFQAVDALFMFFHVYLVLICVQSFAEFQIYSG